MMLVMLIIVSVYGYLIAISINDDEKGFDCGIKFDKGMIRGE